MAFLSWRGGVGWAVFCRTGIIRVGSGLGLRFPQSLCPQSRIFPHAPSANCNPRSCPHSFLSFSSRLAPRSRFVSKILHLSKFTVNCQAPYSFTPFSLAVYPPPSHRQMSLEGATGSDQDGGQSSSINIKAKPGQVRSGA